VPSAGSSTSSTSCATETLHTTAGMLLACRTPATGMILRKASACLKQASCISQLRWPSTCDNGVTCLQSQCHVHIAAGLTSQSGSSRGSAEGETVEIGRSSRVHDSAATTRRGGNAEHNQSQQDGSRKAGEVQPCAPVPMPLHG